jgi:hypothetical protein
VKTHYEILGVEPTADADTIKKAFRKEIARYHPDKVIHLGQEFQDMAASRAAELTVAYKTLTDPALRAEYDAGVPGGPPPSRPAAPDPPPAPEIPEIETPSPTGGRARFAAERADRDVILKRAITGRVLAIVEALYGKLENPAVRGFDLAMVPVAKPRFLGAPPPRVLVKVVDHANGPAITDAFSAAARAGIHAGKSPVVVLLFSREIAPQHEITKANDACARQRKPPGAPDEVAVVVVDTGDWSCRLPPNCSTAVHKLAAQICT